MYTYITDIYTLLIYYYIKICGVFFFLLKLKDKQLEEGLYHLVE